MEFEIKEIKLEGTEFIGIKAGQTAYKKIKDQLCTGINKIVFPADAEVIASYIRGLLCQRDEDCYLQLTCEDPEKEEYVKKWQKEFEGLHMDPDGVDFSNKKKKK